VNHRSLILGAVTVALAAMSTTAWGQRKPSTPDKSEGTATEDQAPPKSTAAPKINPANEELEVPEEAAAPQKPPDKYDAETGGGAATKFVFTPYGLLQGQVTHDSTQSFQHGQGNNPIARSGAPTVSQSGLAYAGQHGRLTMTARNTILGFRVKAPTWHSIVASARVEGDFEGPPPSNPPNSSESGYLTGGPFRMRQAYVLLETPVIDVLVGQTQQLFGWGPNFYPNTVNNLGIPGMAFGREAQVKLSHVFRTSAINVEVAAGAFRPAQRDSEVPDVQAGIRFAVKGWKGIQNGNKLVPMQIAVAGTRRWFRVQGLNSVTTTALEPTEDRAYTATGAGISIDALIPIIPSNDAEHPGNALTLVGEFTKGYGISDLYQSLSFGLPPQPVGSAVTSNSTDVDPGIIVFDQPVNAQGNLLTGQLHPVHMQSFLINLQYTLPGLDMVGLSGIYSYLSSDNVDQLANPLDVMVGSWSKSFLKQRYVEGALHVFVTPVARFSFGYGNTVQTFLDGGQETNHRFIFKANYAF
jgi:hypothetical protein